MVIYYLYRLTNRCCCVNEILSLGDPGEVVLVCLVICVGGFCFVGEEAKVDLASIYRDLRPPLLVLTVPRDTLEPRATADMGSLIRLVLRTCDVSQVLTTIVYDLETKEPMLIAMINVLIWKRFQDLTVHVDQLLLAMSVSW